MDEKVADRIKVLNKVRYERYKMQKDLEDEQTKHKQMHKDAEAAVQMDSGESDEAQRLRNLENRCVCNSLKNFNVIQSLT